MTSCEEMLMGLFDTRNRIVRQLKEQQQLFDQALQSSLLLRGIQPPAWLSGARATTVTGDRCHPGSKEDLIPGLLIPPHKQTANSSLGFCTYNKSEALYSIGTHDFSEEFMTDNMSTLMRGDIREPNGNEICGDSQNGDPPPQTAAMPSEVCIAPDRSLEKITRSRSRQRALEQRNSEKKRETDDKKAAENENTGRVASSRFASQAPRFACQQSDIGVRSMDPLKYCKGFGTEKTVHPLNSKEGSIRDDKIGCRILGYESSPRNRATQQMHDGNVSPPCGLSSVEIAKAAERQPVYGNMLAIQPKELMFDDMEDCSVKNKRPDLDEQILESELLEKNKNMQPESANLANLEDFSEQIQREMVVSGEDLSANESSQIGMTTVDASEGNMMQDVLSSAEQLAEVRKLVDSLNVQSPECSSCSDFQQGIDDTMPNKEVSDVTLRKSTNSSREHIKSEREVTGTKNKREVTEGDVSEVNLDTTRFSSSDHLKIRKLSDSANLEPRKQGVSVGTQRRITRSMSSCFLNGGEDTQRQTASVTGNQNRGASSSRKGLQKVDEFVHSNGLQVRDLDYSLKDMVNETVGIALCGTVDKSVAVLNISPKNCKTGSKASYFLRSRSLTHQRNVDASLMAGSNGSKPRHSSQSFKLSENPMGNVCDLSRPAYWMQPNNDNQLNPKAITSPSMMGDNLQTQNEDAESASGISEAIVESHNDTSNQIHAADSDLDARFDGVEAHQSTEQSDIDRLQFLPSPQAGCSPIFLQEVEPDLKDQYASTPSAFQKTSEFEEQVNEASDYPLTNQQGSERLGISVLDNNKCSDPKDDLQRLGGTKPQVTSVDYSVEEKAGSCVSDTHHTGDTEQDLEKKQPYQEKEFVSPSCPASRTTVCDSLDYSGKHSSTFGVDDSLPVFEGFSVGLPIFCEEPPVMEGSTLYDYLDFSSFKTTAVDGPQICKSTSFLTPRSNATAKYKIHSTPDVYQSLPNGLLEHMRGSFPCDAEDLKHVGTTAGEDGILHEIRCISGLQLMDGSLKGSYCGSNARSDAKLRKGIRSPAASTPASGKFSERTLLKSNSSSSGKQFKNPELTCFRIEEEETDMNEENGHVDLDDVSEISPKRNCLRMNMPENALADISMSQCGSSDINDEGKTFLHSNNTNRDHMEIAFAGKESGVSKKHSDERKNVTDDKENRYPSFSVGKSEKVSNFLPKRTSKAKLSGNVGRANGSQAVSEKDRKLNNIVANISSFVPLIQQKKPVPGKFSLDKSFMITTGCCKSSSYFVFSRLLLRKKLTCLIYLLTCLAFFTFAAKRDVKVKALEAAEAAKRLEEKKEIERKMRKEAAKLEREKLMLENLKQMEEQKRREEEKKQKRRADLAKRQQRDEEEKKEKERKRKLIEESRKQFRLAEEKELQHKVDKDEFKRKEAKRQKVEKGRDGIEQMKTALSGTGIVGASDAGPSEHVRGEGEAVAVLRDKLIGTNTLANVDKGCSSGIEETEEMQYEMSPYRGSDDEEEEDDDMARRKFIPSWARKENLIPVLCRQQHVDPDVIFPSIKGCNLNEVLGSNNFSRYRDRNGRGESGCWLNDRFTQQEEYQYKLKMGYIKL
ncbi:hypothetical protein EJ110_NYTH48562 [Nymphaea thermarum]|nr:hypothetical protein EJ110_NYTH48562 [Nymphaea thermarum]